MRIFAGELVQRAAGPACMEEVHRAVVPSWHKLMSYPTFCGIQVSVAHAPSRRMSPATPAWPPAARSPPSGACVKAARSVGVLDPSTAWSSPAALASRAGPKFSRPWPLLRHTRRAGPHGCRMYVAAVPSRSCATKAAATLERQCGQHFCSAARAGPAPRSVRTQRCFGAGATCISGTPRSQRMQRPSANM